MLEVLELPMGLMYEKIWSQWEIIFCTTRRPVDISKLSFSKAFMKQTEQEVETQTKTQISITHFHAFMKVHRLIPALTQQA